MSNRRKKYSYQKGYTGLFRRICRDCEATFSPTGKYTRYCDKCRLERMNYPGKKIKDVEYDGRKRLFVRPD